MAMKKKKKQSGSMQNIVSMKKTMPKAKVASPNKSKYKK